MLERLRKLKSDWKRRIILRYLEKTDSEKILESARKKLVSAFGYAYKNIPAYKKILKEKKFYGDVGTTEGFGKIPVITKEDVFRFDISELCVNGLKDMKSAMASSGFSGRFSYGIVTERDDEEIMKNADFFFDYFFKADRIRTLLINSNAMGVSFKSSYPLINTSVKSDTISAFIKIFKKDFEQFIILGDPHFIKKMLEDGKKYNLDWKKLNVSLVWGGDWGSNSLEMYFKNMLGIENSPDKSTVGYTMGLTELGLNLSFSSAVLSKIREICQKDEKLRKLLFGSIKSVPEMMLYIPTRSYIEVINKDENGFGELVFSMLEKTKMPLIRYNSKDIGKIFTYNEFKNALESSGYKDVPEFKLPILAFFGRASQGIKFGKEEIRVCDIKEAIYRDFEVAGKITGYFRMSKAGLQIQLKEGVKLNHEITKKIESIIFNFIKTRTPIKVYSYYDFPFGMALDYENKFKCI